MDLAEVDINADKGLLEIVWNNLLLNAIKVNKHKGLLQVELASEGENVIVSITDSGCGMSPQVVEHIFEKFYQGDNSRSSDGNGLGLALVNKVVDLHNGFIKVNSEEGKGTKIEVFLPNVVI